MLRFFTADTCLFFATLLTSAAVQGAEASVTYHCQPGPWGNIDYQFVYLAAPDSILDAYPVPDPQTQWSFEGHPAGWVQAFLATSGLDAATITRLFADPRSHPDKENVVTLYPTEKELLALTPMARETLYHELAESEENPFFHDPICIPDGNIDAWLHGTDLPAKIIGLVSKLAYHDGGSLLFSDVPEILKYASSDDEARHFIKILTRVRAVIAYLELDGKEDLPALEKYWSADFHRSDQLPMLEATAAIPDGTRVDITHLFPPLPRRLVYSYTDPDIERTGQTPNCHWTSLNFFNYTRQNILLDLKLATSDVLQDYDKVDAPYTFGDVLFFLSDEGDAFHSCVFIADNLVYTKNGENEMMPWILTRLDDVKQVYDRTGTTKIQAYRRRWPTGG